MKPTNTIPNYKVALDKRNRTRAVANDIFTPPSATRILFPYLDRDWVIWECCWGEGHMAQALQQEGFKVVGGKDEDIFFSQTKYAFDAIVTNPPYSKQLRNRMLELIASYDKPFAVLLRLEHLGGQGSHRIFRSRDLELIIPSGRFHFLTPSGRANNTFGNLWVTRGLRTGALRDQSAAYFVPYQSNS